MHPVQFTLHDQWSEASDPPLLATHLALLLFLPPVQGQAVMVMTNVTTVVTQLHSQEGTLSMPLCSHAAQLLLWANTHNISILPQYIPGKLSIIADHLFH